METLKKKLCWVNSEFEGGCHCFRTVKYIKRRIMCKRDTIVGGDSRKEALHVKGTSGERQDME